MYVSKENTWMQHLRKNQYIGRTKTIKDPLIRQSQEFLAGKFTDFDYTNDAIFESFRDYPRKKQLYRKHKDIAKDYERKVKFYKSCQRWFSTESNRQIQHVEERFSKLLQYTFESNVKKTKGLQKGYSKWLSRHGKLSEIDKESEEKVWRTAVTPEKEIQEENTEDSPVRAVSSQNRAHSLRSVSVDNIPQVEEVSRLSSARHGLKFESDGSPIVKSFSHLDISQVGKHMTKSIKNRKHTVKLGSN